MGVNEGIGKTRINTGRLLYELLSRSIEKDVKVKKKTRDVGGRWSKGSKRSSETSVFWCNTGIEILTVFVI